MSVAGADGWSTGETHRSRRRATSRPTTCIYRARFASDTRAERTIRWRPGYSSAPSRSTPNSPPPRRSWRGPTRFACLSSRRTTARRWNERKSPPKRRFDSTPISQKPIKPKPPCYGGRSVGSPTSEQSDRKSTRLNSSHLVISYAVFCLKKKKKEIHEGIVNHAKIVIPAARSYANTLQEVYA